MQNDRIRERINGAIPISAYRIIFQAESHAFRIYSCERISHFAESSNSNSTASLTKNIFECVNLLDMSVNFKIVTLASCLILFLCLLVGREVAVV